MALAVLVSVLIDHDSWQYAYVMCRRALADFMDAFIAASLRVSATTRRVAAAYGDAYLL